MIHVTPLSRLSETLRATRATHLVSLLSVDAPPPCPAHLDPACCLHLAMHDITEERPGLVAPTPEHVAALLAFARSWNRVFPLVVHCYAGISRSTAAAYCMAAALDPTRDERALALELRRRCPAATPNIRIVRIADEMLGRRGRMAEAIRAIGRGADACEGEPFTLPVPRREIKRTPQ
ncbi:tyrosine phosphatase family protein [Chelativorans intermedius]|uniref:Tyrosine phosphatase family protein n=1 Tax=Chelativorans intermedius TaxID=515947 RepID=A0ABV6D407_9HYPH|nr:tyrosine protein phosphatase [Chelativorans intermedius]MCT8997079.1 tyrosine protein phosphatase [Chelativorans intermedius]